jgi:hypothetical protein
MKTFSVLCIQGCHDLVSCSQEFHSASQNANVPAISMQIWRHVKDEVFESWANLALTPDHSKPAERIEASAKQRSGESVFGLRRRLHVCAHPSH